MRRVALPLLVILNAGLLCFLAWVWFTPDGQVRGMRWQSPAPVKVDLQALLPALPGQGQADTSQFLGMLERPLFSPTRRPPPPPPPPKAEVPEPVNRFAQAKLTGVFEGAGVGGIIINYEGKDRRVPLNGLLDGWTLHSVAGMQATFTQSGQTRTVSLQRAVLGGATSIKQSPQAVSAGPNYVNRGARRSAPVLSSAPTASTVPPSAPAPSAVAPSTAPAPSTALVPSAEPPKASFGGRSAPPR